MYIAKDNTHVKNIISFYLY